MLKILAEVAINQRARRHQLNSYEREENSITTRHKIPQRVSDKLVKVTFELSASDWHDHGAETMWAVSLGQDQYRLENIPFYAYGVSYDDVVIAKPVRKQLLFQSVFQRGGHSTYRIFLLQHTSIGEFEKSWLALEEIGCSYERATDQLFAIDVPPETDIDQAYSALERGEKAKVWDFEEANCAHPACNTPEGSGH